MKKDKIHSIVKEILSEDQAFKLHTNTTYLRDLVKINTFSPNLRKKILSILDYADKNNGIISLNQLRLIRKYLTATLNVEPVRKMVREVIKKINGKYAVYPKKGGKRLGTHSTRAAAEKQLAAIHINKEAVEETFPFQIKDKQFDEEDNSLISVDYTFDTPTKTYRVVLNSGEYGPEDRIFDLSFGVDKGDFNKIDTFQMTGEGSVRKIISTIVKIIEDFINRFDVNRIKASATTEKRQRVYKALFSRLPSSLSDKVEINEVIEPADPSKVNRKELRMGIRVEMEHTDDPKEAQHIALQHLAEDPKYYSKLATLNLEGEHDPMNPGILKKRLGKLSCTKVRKERAKLKDKGTTYAKALQRYLNYHCQ